MSQQDQAHGWRQSGGSEAGWVDRLRPTVRRRNADLESARPAYEINHGFRTEMPSIATDDRPAPCAGVRWVRLDACY